MTDSGEKSCPFCVENGFVKIIDELEFAYLVQVTKNVDGEMVEQVGRYFIIPKQHIESILERPNDWTRDENLLLWSAITQAENDQTLMRLMGGRELTESLNTSWNNGWWAGQRVRHSHMWVIFRYDELAVGLDATIGRVKDLEKTEVKLREQITGLQFQAMELEGEVTGLRRQSGLQLNGN